MEKGGCGGGRGDGHGRGGGEQGHGYGDRGHGSKPGQSSGGPSASHGSVITSPRPRVHVQVASSDQENLRSQSPSRPPPGGGLVRQLIQQFESVGVGRGDGHGRGGGDRGHGYGGRGHGSEPGQSSGGPFASRGSVITSPRHWAFLDFTRSESDRKDNYMKVWNFVNQLIKRCSKLGMQLEKAPIVFESFTKDTLSDAENLKKLLETVIGKASSDHGVARPTLLLCAMSNRDKGYETLKQVAKTKLSLVTQCFLMNSTTMGCDQYQAELALKINAKVGGSIPFYGTEGADVNHPAS